MRLRSRAPRWSATTGAGAPPALSLWPQRVRCLVTGNGYNIQDIARSGVPASPEQEHRFWYQ